MNRDKFLEAVSSESNIWDIIIIGGGATGLGILHEASLRGHKAVLFEAEDFCSGTSSKSTKLFHGGVRYLKDFSIPKLLESAREQAFLKKTAPHIVKDIPFIIPTKSFTEHLYFRAGILLFDILTSIYKKQLSFSLNKKTINAKIPNLDTKNTFGGILYYDAQFDDARLAITIAKSSSLLGGIPLNYCKVISLNKDDNKISSVRVKDLVNDKEFNVKAKVIINACGPFVDSVCKMDNEESEDLILPMQGSHIILPLEFLGGESAFIIPNTSRGTVLYGIPWEGKCLIGTTEVALNKVSENNKANESEIKYLLEESSKYLIKKPNFSDIISSFSGIRPLLKPKKKSKVIPREHEIIISESGLITITGGKWTTYRVMAKDLIRKIDALKLLPNKRNKLSKELFFSLKNNFINKPHLEKYGSEAQKIIELEKNNPELKIKIHPKLDITYSIIQYAVEEEMAQTIDDILSRRTRASLLNKEASLKACKDVGLFMQKLLNKDKEWLKKQILDFKEKIS